MHIELWRGLVTVHDNTEPIEVIDFDVEGDESQLCVSNGCFEASHVHTVHEPQ